MVDFGRPFRGKKLERLKDFLAGGGLDYDEGIEFTVNLLDDHRNIIATGSVQDNVLKCIQVHCTRTGEGLTGTIMTYLNNYAAEQGRSHLFLFTKPHNDVMFREFGFHEVSRTRDVLLMENSRDGIGAFVRSLECPTREGVIGSVVCNCNPFTWGHRYLMEKAASECDLVHVFVLSEDRSVFPARDRMEMVRSGTADLQNVVVHPTADYLISSATFPTYFLKERADAAAVNCELDFTIFRDHFAAPMGIVRRYVGTEPYCVVTGAYNLQMKEFFAGSDLHIVEVERKRDSAEVQISASRVRELLASGQAAEAMLLVPPSTREYLESDAGKKVVRMLQKAER